MWFCDIPAELGIGQHLPWYRSREFASSSQEKRPPFRIDDVYGPKDLKRLQRLDTQRVIVRIMPEAELIRDDNFLDSLIKVVKQRSLPVELAGSILGHAYYKLKNAGLNVFSAEPYSAYYRTRGRKVFRKLVRDEIPEAIASKGERVIEARLSARESLRGLVAKLFEEGLEAVRAETRDEVLEELADVFEVLRGMIHDVGFTLENISQVADRKRAVRGGFEKYRVLIETSLPRPSVAGDTPSSEGQITLREVGSIEIEGGTIYVPFARLLADGHPIWIKVEVGGKIANVGICLEKAGVAVAIEADDRADRSRLRQLELDLDRQ